MITDNTPLILASASARRIELMHREGFQPLIQPADIDETLPEGIGPRDAVLFLALKKALHAATDAPAGSLVVGADTIVYKDGIIGKPRDRADAEAILTRLAGTAHQVMTGVAVVQAGCRHSVAFCDVTDVYFKPYTVADLAAYLASDEPFDKAGAYAIQGYFSRYIDHIEGDYDNVVGLPVTRLKTVLAGFDNAVR